MLVGAMLVGQVAILASVSGKPLRVGISAATLSRTISYCHAGYSS